MNGCNEVRKKHWLKQDIAPAGNCGVFLGTVAFWPVGAFSFLSSIMLVEKRVFLLHFYCVHVLIVIDGN
uniref:Uncharacterized protein n=1 Tax=Geobacillus sp. (strain Y4.1MC1) TaxID=581103 RepID=A0A7U3YHY3_GEOS0